MAILGAVLAWQWHQAVPGAPGPAWIIAYGVVEAALVACALTLIARALVLGARSGSLTF